jgi:hypothetical protein
MYVYVYVAVRSVSSYEWHHKLLETNTSIDASFSIAVLKICGKSYVACMSIETSFQTSIRGYDVYKQIKGSVICGNYG